MITNLPYRDVPLQPRPTAPQELAIELPGATQRLSTLRFYFSCFVGLVFSWGLARETPTLGLLAAVATVVGNVMHARRERVPPTVSLRVVGDELLINAAPGQPVRIKLDELRDVEMEGKDIRRRSEREAVGPTIPTTVSEYGDVARVVFVTTGARVNLTETWAAHPECSERFRKVRLFLRAHGWLPASERVSQPDSD